MTTDAMVVDVSKDWVIAARVQQRFMQGWDPAIDTLDYSAGCRQVLELGGDCYDFVPLADQRLAVTIADASGKGLAAALMISNVQSSLRTAMLLGAIDLAGALKVVNRQVYASSSADRYATLFCGVFDGATRTLRYVNAGHNPPGVIRNGSVFWLETGGAPVGAFPDWTYQEGAVQLNPRDLVVAYTDGVTEAVNPGTGKEWGIEGLLKAAIESHALCADDIVRRVFSCMDGFSQGCQSDDATVVALRVH